MKLTWQWVHGDGLDCKELKAIRIRKASYRRDANAILQYQVEGGGWAPLPGAPEFPFNSIAQRYAANHIPDLIAAVPRSTLPRDLLMRRDLRDTVDQLDELIESTSTRAREDLYDMPDGWKPTAAVDVNGRPLLADMLAAKANALAALAQLERD